MDRRYTSFLVRCWSLADDRRRLEVIHVQSGERARVGSLDEAFAWLAARTAPAPAAAPTPRPADEETPPS
jgi:hypothetical protein